ncbi:MAG: hypothetical protein ACEQSX_18755 [Baekduiaceae bacterium]
MSRFIAAALGVACMAVLAGSAFSVSSAQTTGPPEGCTDGVTSTGQQQFTPFGYDIDCVVLSFTKSPSSPTTDTNAEITWKVEIFGFPEGSDWTQWQNKVCKLDGVVVPCTDTPGATFTNLAPGEHVFTVEAETPSLFDGEEGPRSARAATVNPNAECENGFKEGDRLSCVKVSGEVRWTVQPAQTTTTPAATTETTPPPAVTAAAPPAPRACESRRTLTIRLRERKGERISSARVVFNGKTIATSRRTSDGRVIAKIDFRKLPSGRFSVQIRAKFTNGKTRTYTRKYFTCEPKRPPSNNLESASAI